MTIKPKKFKYKLEGFKSKSQKLSRMKPIPFMSVDIAEGNDYSCTVKGKINKKTKEIYIDSYEIK